MPINDRDLLGHARHAYLIGIGGCGMSALARVLKHHGLMVSGSDLADSKRICALRSEGIQVSIGQKDISFMDSDLVIYSSAISNAIV